MPSWYRDPTAPEPNLPRSIGVAALIERDGSLLLEQRADDGTWGIVAGTVKNDETVVEALRRELDEETGLAARGVELFGVISDPSQIVAYGDGSAFAFVALVFRVEVGEGEPRASAESRQVRFAPLADLGELELTPTHRPIVEAYLDRPATVVLA